MGPRSSDKCSLPRSRGIAGGVVVRRLGEWWRRPPSLKLRRASCGLPRRSLGEVGVEVGQVEGGGDFLDFIWVLNEGDDFHGAAAIVADERVDLVDFLDERGPGL